MMGTAKFWWWLIVSAAEAACSSCGCRVRVSRRRQSAAAEFYLVHGFQHCGDFPRDRPHKFLVDAIESEYSNSDYVCRKPR